MATFDMERVLVDARSRTVSVVEAVRIDLMAELREEIRDAIAVSFHERGIDDFAYWHIEVSSDRAADAVMAVLFPDYVK